MANEEQTTIDPDPLPAKPVLVVAAGGVTQPLWKDLAERYQLAFLVTGAAQLAGEMGIADAIPVMMVADPDMREDAANTAVMMATKVVNAMPEVHQRFGDVYGNVGPELFGERLKTWWPGYANYQLQELSLLVMALDKFCTEHKVVGFLTHEDLTPMMRCATLFFKARGIPTIQLPHATCHLLPEAGPDIHTETRTEVILAYGKYMAEFYERAGFEGRIVMTGAPQWDGLYDEMTIPDKAEARRVLRLKVEEGQRVIAYASTWAQTTSLRSRFEDELKEGLAAVIGLAKLWNAQLIVKMHPSEAAENQAHYLKQMEEAGVTGIATPFHLNYVLRAADLLIAQSPSNLCIEAAILGTPSVYIQTEGFDYQNALPLRGQTVELAELAEAALKGDTVLDWDSFISYYNAAHIGKGAAVEAAVAAIEELCPV